MPTRAQEADEDEGDENIDQELRKNRLAVSLGLGRRKKKEVSSFMYHGFLRNSIAQLVEAMLWTHTRNSWPSIPGVRVPLSTTMRCWMRVWLGRLLNSAIYPEISVFYFLLSNQAVIDIAKGSVQRMRNYWTFIANCALQFPNSRKTSMSYNKHPKNLRLYRNRCEFHFNFLRCI